jgi:hypothetical protein
MGFGTEFWYSNPRNEAEKNATVGDAVNLIKAQLG